MIKQFHRILVFVIFITSISITSYGQKFDRGIDIKNAPVFIPKGSLEFGGTISYKDYKFFDYKFLVLEDLNASGFSLKASPYISFFFGDNLAAGAKFVYKRSLIKLDNASLNINEDLGLEIKDFYNLAHTYYGALTFRNYISLGNSMRFGFFNEIALTAGAGQSKLISGKGEELVGTFQNIFELGIGVVPGLIAFVTNDLAVEVSVGIMGLNYKKVTQLTNQVIEGSYETSSADFKIDLFSINIGVSFVIPYVLGNKSDNKKVK